MIAETDRELARIMSEARIIAVVGLSPKAHRPSHEVARYLMSRGYTVIPVNPGHTEILGQKCYPDLASIPVRVDIVEVFRNSHDVPPIVDGAIRCGARCLWLQIGVINDVAAEKASAAGLDVVLNRCLKIEHAALIG